MVKAGRAVKIEQEESKQADQLELIYYTDPLCCWSWGMEPQLRRLRFEYDGQITLRYCMGGLLPGWKNYHDEMNSVSRPIQMGPVWMHAEQLSGMPMHSTIWFEDPPATSYPSCIAVKCAALQSSAAGERYLRLVREAVMLQGKNISKESVLIEIAGNLAGESSYNFNILQFKADLKNDVGLEAFRRDLQEIQYRQVSRFPTLTIKGSGNQGLVLTGYRPYSSLLSSLQQIAPHLQKSNSAIDKNTYKKFWSGLTQREEEEILNV